MASSSIGRSFNDSLRKQDYVPTTKTRAIKASDPSVALPVITDRFKNFEASSQRDFLGSAEAKSFIRRLEMVVEVSTVNNPVFRKLLTPAQGEEETEIPVEYNTLLYAALLLLLRGDALQIVERYSDSKDGVAAFFSLKQAIFRDESGLYLSWINKAISDFKMNVIDDPRPQLKKMRDLQDRLRKLSAYEWDNQQSVIKSHLPERYSKFVETDYENATQLVSAVSAYCFNYVKPQVDAAAQRNQLKQVQNAATIAGIDGQTNGDNGGGGKGGYGKKQQVRTYPPRGNGK